MAQPWLAVNLEETNKSGSGAPGGGGSWWLAHRHHRVLHFLTDVQEEGQRVRWPS